MIYRFFIDNTEWQEDGNISGWQSIKRTIQRNNNQGEGILITADAELKFHNSLFDYFYNEFISGNICRDFNLIIIESKNGNTFNEFYRGKLFLTDFEFELKTKTAKTKIQDNSYYSRINNNKSIKTSPIAGRSKNDISIPACDIWNIQTMICDTGVAYNTVEAFRVYDVLNYLIQFMSDSEMEFHSEAFDIGGEYEGAFITTGYSLRTEIFDTIPFEISWSDIISELYKNFNIAYEIEVNPVTLKPVMVVEPQQKLYDTNIVMAFNDPTDVKIKYKTENNYSTIRIGSTITSEPQQTYLPYPEGLNLLSFKEEEYIVLGQCNIDSTLDIVRSWIVSSNIIFDINFHLNSEYDTEIALIMCDTLNTTAKTAVCKKTNTLTGASAPLFYNEDLLSVNCLLRFYGALPNSLIKYLGTTDNTFLATLNSNQIYNTNTWPATVSVQPFPFANDSILPGYDAGGNYNNATYRYVAPLTGLYSFEVNMIYQAVVSLQGLVNFKVNIKRYDSGNNLISSVSSQPVNCPNNTNPSLIYSGNVTATMNTFMAVTDYVVVELEYVILNIAGTTTLTINSNSHFACTNSHNYGGAFHSVDPNEYRALNFIFDYPVTQEDINTILNNKKGKYKVVYDGVEYTGWIEKCVINSAPNKQSAEITLISNLNLLN